jgi:uncharacterized oxidoreductase
MAHVVKAEYLEDLTAAIFQKHGAPPEDARIVARLLVEADLMGLHSHGTLRVPQYVADIRQGTIAPGAALRVVEQTPAAVLVDANWNFGQVGATRAAGLAVERARNLGLGCASLRRCRHVGRVGAYTEQAAAQGCVALAACSTAGEGHWVAPFGGRQGRLGTNPLAFAAPTGGTPVSMDFATSALPEGRVRFYRDTNQSLPPDSLLDKEGKPTLDPHDLYAPGRKPLGAILPFGGPQGYKGYSLALMAEILSALLGVPAWMEKDLEGHGNNVWLLAIDVERFMSAERFRAELGGLIDYIRSSAPAQGSKGILMPGQREFDLMEARRREGVPLEEGVWKQVKQTAEEAGVEV